MAKSFAQGVCGLCDDLSISCANHELNFKNSVLCALHGFYPKKEEQL